jgi:sortase (surface protein transpeptidase)
MKRKKHTKSIFSFLSSKSVRGKSYSGLFAQKQAKTKKTKKKSSILDLFLKIFLNFLIIISFGSFAFWQGPKLFYTLFPQEVAQAEELKGDFKLELNLLDEEATKRTVLPSKRSYKPTFNPNLPEGDWLVIPRIGVRSELQPTEDYEEALNTGLWWVPDFGKAGDRSKPMIVAGHRYGFDWWWKDDYWKYHSFYSLPELEVGDRVEVISGQRKWIYEIYGGEEGEQITDYEADLILYTCKHLDSPIRIFRYAKIVEVEQGSALGILNQ